jgi:hypothetical protein
MEIISELNIRGAFALFTFGACAATLPPSGIHHLGTIAIPSNLVPAEEFLLYLDLRNFYFDMAFRGTESPMDFEWQGRHGPIDPSSPFHKHMMDAQAKKRMPQCPVTEVLC